MFRLKPFFISPYVIGIVCVALYSSIQFLSDTSKLSWLIASVCALSACIYFAYIYIRYPREVQFSLLAVTVVSLLSPVIVFADYWQNGETGLLPFYLSLGCAIGWLIYDKWYSQMPFPTAYKTILQKPLPNLPLEGRTGETQEVNFENGRYNILLFHRGAWCPFCVAQVREAANLAGEVHQANAQLHMISNKRPNHFDFSQDRFSEVAHHWGDPDLKASRILGISHMRGLPIGLEILGFESNSTLPASIVTDPTGKVIYRNVVKDYRKRPSIQFFLRIVDAHKKGEFDPSKVART